MCIGCVPAKTRERRTPPSLLKPQRYPAIPAFRTGREASLHTLVRSVQQKAAMT